MWRDVVCILCWSSHGRWATPSYLERCGLPSLVEPFLTAFVAVLKRVWYRMTPPTRTRAPKSKAAAVCWVVPVSYTQRKAGCVLPTVLTQVLGITLTGELKVGGGCVYRWALSLTQVSKVLIPLAQLGKMLCLDRADWWPGLCFHHLEYVRKVNQIEIPTFLSG